MTDLIDTRDTEHLLHTFLAARGLEHDPVFRLDPDVYDALADDDPFDPNPLVLCFDTVETELAERAYEDDLIGSGFYEPLDGDDLLVINCPVAERPALIATIARMNFQE